MRVLIACDKFKDALTAPQACGVIAATLEAVHPEWTTDLCPLADGGEGFADILTRAAGGRMISLTVTGPRGAPQPAGFGLVALDRIPAAARARLNLPPEIPADATLAVIEMATASGLALLAPADRDPWHTTTAGTGELIRAAASHGVAAILLGVGGSATNDLGLGTLDALGLRCTDNHASTIRPPIPARWPEVTRLAGKISPPLPPIRIACDVTNPLLGPRGAAAVYGPQKGLRPEDLARLDGLGARLGLMLCHHCGQPDTALDVPGAGAAGGIAFGLMVGAGAQLLPGVDLVDAWLDLGARLAAADLVITGEGRFDESSLNGKGPGAVAARALALGKPVQVFAGQIQAANPPPGLRLHAITPPGLPLADALKAAPDLLAASVREHC
jgi:glycerate kinase